uniref:hypothetical protein n=1 Tax=Streptomyces sp. S501 TaxID=2420135 RepID=UPI00142F61EC|nr:hypothetical protein [Streptomyces sp. S501]
MSVLRSAGSSVSCVQHQGSRPTLSIAADLLTLIGTTLTITLELRRARNADQPDEYEEDQHK